ncbi:MAG TPA: type II secretion system protein [Bacillota bacterium]|nr:type II secretion system protein [Bacillota bacterium]
MPTLGTGRTGNAGYTLIEILAVLTLIGFITLMVLPSLIHGEEKARVGNIGRLIIADLKEVREEAALSHSKIVVSFSAQGYSFALGDIPVQRQFPEDHFHFELPEPPEVIEPVADTVSLQTETAGESVDESETATDNQTVETMANQISFTAAGQMEKEFRLTWETEHYRGTLTVDPAGKAEWHNEPK